MNKKSRILGRAEAIFGGKIQIRIGVIENEKLVAIDLEELIDACEVGEILSDNAPTYGPQIRMIIDNINSLRILRDALDCAEQWFKTGEIGEPMDCLNPMEEDAVQEGK